MNSLKKIFILTCCCFLALSFTACRNNNKTTTEATSRTETSSNMTTHADGTATGSGITEGNGTNTDDGVVGNIATDIGTDLKDLGETLESDLGIDGTRATTAR